MIIGFTLVSITLIAVTLKFTLFEVNNDYKLNSDGDNNNVLQNSGDNNNVIQNNGDNNYTEFNSTIDLAKKWTVSLEDNVDSENTCYVCKSVFKNTNKDQQQKNDIGNFIYNDIPFPIKINRVNDVQIKNINVYSINDDETTLSTYYYGDIDELKNTKINIPYNNNENTLVLGVSSTGLSSFESQNLYSKNEAILSMLDVNLHNEIMAPMMKQAVESKIELANINNYNPIYLGITQYYYDNQKKYNNFPTTSNSPSSGDSTLEPKVAFYLIEIVDTNLTSEYFLYGSKISYYSLANFDVQKGDNVEQIIIPSHVLQNDDTLFNSFISGNPRKQQLNDQIRYQIRNLYPSQIGLNSASYYYLDDRINEVNTKQKYEQIVKKINEVSKM